MPGPLLAKYTRLWYAWQQYGDNFHWTNVKLHRKMGKSAKILYYYYLTLLPIRISGGNITPPPRSVIMNSLYLVLYATAYLH